FARTNEASRGNRSRDARRDPRVFRNECAARRICHLHRTGKRHGGCAQRQNACDARRRTRKRNGRPQSRTQAGGKRIWNEQVRSLSNTSIRKAMKNAAAPTCGTAAIKRRRRKWRSNELKFI